jgi:hypothetical protein
MEGDHVHEMLDSGDRLPRKPMADFISCRAEELEECCGWSVSLGNRQMIGGAVLSDVLGREILHVLYHGKL